MDIAYGGEEGVDNGEEGEVPRDDDPGEKGWPIIGEGKGAKAEVAVGTWRAEGW